MKYTSDRLTKFGDPVGRHRDELLSTRVVTVALLCWVVLALAGNARVVGAAEEPGTVVEAHCIGFDGLVRWAIAARRSFDGEIRELATSNLEAIGPRAGDCLRELLEDPDSQVRADAAWQLGDFPGDLSKTVIALRGSLEDADHQVRAQAAGSLGNLGGVSVAAVPELRLLLQDPDGLVAGAAAEALGAIGEPVEEIVPALISVLKSRTDNVGVEASHALADLGPRAAIGVPEMVGILASERRRLEETFRRDPETRVMSVAQIWEWEDLTLSVLSVLSHIGPAAGDAGPELRSLYEHEHLYVRLLVAAAIWSVLGDPEPTIETAVGVLDEARLQEAETIRLASTQLCRLGAAAEPAIPSLRRILESSADPNVRAEAARIVEIIEAPTSPGESDPCVD